MWRNFSNKWKTADAAVWKAVSIFTLALTGVIHQLELIDKMLKKIPMFKKI